MATIGNEYLYTGRRLDPETGLQYNRNRFYNAQLGRFLTRDPIAYWGSEWNLYEYVKGIPLDHVDPSGLIAGDAAICFIACMLDLTTQEAKDIWKKWGKAKVSRRFILKKIAKFAGKKAIPIVGQLWGCYDLARCTARCLF